jgi:hypothetical protein
MQVHSYLATAPRAAGVQCALFYLTLGENVCGWCTGANDDGIVSAYFALELYYAAQPTVYCRSAGGDLRGAWQVESAPITTEIRCPLPEPVIHDLLRHQSDFGREWLWYAGEPGSGAESDAYRKLGLSPRTVNIRSSQLPRFDRSRPVWVHTSPGTDLNLVLSVKKHWLSDSGQLRALG